ncbi:MAG: hypothetical protein WC071_07410 [Victivallaceae bacterium]
MRKSPYFTLIEVAIAIAVLAMGVVAAMSMISAAKKRMMKAERGWHEQHMLTQAVEYLMLAPPKSSVPLEIFPYPGFSVNYEYSLPEELPNKFPATVGNWTLVSLKVHIISNEQRNIGPVVLNRIVKNGDI